MFDVTNWPWLHPHYGFGSSKIILIMIQMQTVRSEHIVTMAMYWTLINVSVAEYFWGSWVFQFDCVSSLWFILLHSEEFWYRLLFFLNLSICLCCSAGSFWRTLSPHSSIPLHFAGNSLVFSLFLTLTRCNAVSFRLLSFWFFFCVF